MTDATDVPRVAILAGGLGTRLSEETAVTPKPMVEIGGRPLLWHIMRHYAHHGFSEFCLALGYRGEVVKRYFLEYHQLAGDLTVDLKAGQVDSDVREREDWKVHLVDTGPDTQTGGRVRRLRRWLGERTFMVTYGDGVSNVDLEALLRFHREHGRVGTVTAVRPPARFGGLLFDGDRVREFTEKPQVGEGWINGGFMVFEPAVFDYLEGDGSSLEVDALEPLATAGELMAYRHDDCWQPMDTLRDVRLLRSQWNTGNPAWKF